MSERSTARLTIFIVLVVALLITLVGRAIQMTLLRGGDYAVAAESNDTRTLTQLASRGAILDWEGTPLAGSKASLLVRIDPNRLPTLPEDRSNLFAKVGAQLGVSGADLRAKMLPCGSPGSAEPPVCNEGNPAEPAVVAADVDRRTVRRIIEMPENYPGVEVVAQPLRSYPRSDLRASHLLGYLGRVTADELRDSSSGSATDLVGRTGLEEQYNSDLAGQAGERHVRVDKTGQVVEEQRASQPIPGSTLVTSLDADLQAAVETSLRKQIGNSAKSGGAVVLDVRTGRVLALASFPDFDPDIWTGGISEADYRKLVSRKALLNNPVQGIFPPGSTFKPVTVLAMERSGYDLHGQYGCPATYSAAGQEFANHGSTAYGTLSLAQAVEVSCNTVFYRAADELWRKGGRQRSSATEIDPIARAAADLGLGKKTGIDLPSESTGIVASPAVKYNLWQERHEAWCAAAEEGYPELSKSDQAKAKLFTELDKENCESGNQWRQGDAINAGIGQGMTAVTTLQLAGAYAAIAGDGRVRTPTIGRAIIDADGDVREVEPELVDSVVVNKKTRRFLASAMSRVPVSGTAAGAFAGFPLSQHPIAGKTGTAQVQGKESTAWFASFAPVDKPRYVVVVSVAEGGSGGGIAASISRQIYEAIFGVGRPAVLPHRAPTFAIPSVKSVETSEAPSAVRQ